MATAPGIRHWLPLPGGPLRESMLDPLGFAQRMQERYGDVARLQVGPVLVHLVFHPDHVRHVLHDRQKIYLRGWHYRLLRNLLGENLVVSEGDYWLRQRRLAQPAFHRQRLAGYAGVMVDATAQMLARWGDEAASGETIEIGAEMSRLSLAIAGRTLFSRDVSHEADAVGRALGELGRDLEHRFHHPLTSLPAWVPTPRNRRFRETAHTLNGIVAELIRERRREGRDHGDLLSMLMQARDEETGAAMTDDQLHSEVLTFFLAGHETTATALTWMWYLLASHAAIRQRVRAEVGSVLGARVPGVDDVPHLVLTRMAIEEAMRLYPPIWALPRQAVADDEIGGYRIPARSTVVICSFLTHRHPAAWDRPDEFDPERFTPERVAQRPKYAYFPFLAGPHQCIGNEFALLEMRLIAAQVLQRFDLALVDGPPIVPRASLSLRPSRPVRVQLKPAGACACSEVPAE